MVQGTITQYRKIPNNGSTIALQSLPHLYILNASSLMLWQFFGNLRDDPSQFVNSLYQKVAITTLFWKTFFLIKDTNYQQNQTILEIFVDWEKGRRMFFDFYNFLSFPLIRLISFQKQYKNFMCGLFREFMEDFR